jgi:hypothetical protein
VAVAAPVPQKHFDLTMRRSRHLRLRAIDTISWRYALAILAVAERATSDPLGLSYSSQVLTQTEELTSRQGYGR